MLVDDEDDDWYLVGLEDESIAQAARKAAGIVIPTGPSLADLIDEITADLRPNVRTPKTRASATTSKTNNNELARASGATLQDEKTPAAGSGSIALRKKGRRRTAPGPLRTPKKTARVSDPEPMTETAHGTDAAPKPARANDAGSMTPRRRRRSFVNPRPSVCARELPPTHDPVR